MLAVYAACVRRGGLWQCAALATALCCACAFCLCIFMLAAYAGMRRYGAWQFRPATCTTKISINCFEPAAQKWRRVCAGYLTRLAWAAWRQLAVIALCLGGVCQCLVWLGASVEGRIMPIAWGVCLGSSVCGDTSTGALYLPCMRTWLALKGPAHHVTLAGACWVLAGCFCTL